MSSMRNAVQRRNHRERAQPVERQKWGVLEKHKDYSLRAKDYNEKKKRLQALRQKAVERNPDEFHFGMTSSKAYPGGGKIKDRGNPVLSQEAVKLLKTQDAGYLKTMAQSTRKARERLEQECTLSAATARVVQDNKPGPSPNTHMLFVETNEDQRRFKAQGTLQSRKSEPHSIDESSLMEQDDSTDIDEDPKSRQVSGEEISDLRMKRTLRKQRERGRQARISRLKLLQLRERDLFAAEQELELQRARMSNSVGGVNKAGVKWKIRERKR